MTRLIYQANNDEPINFDELLKRAQKEGLIDFTNLEIEALQVGMIRFGDKTISSQSIVEIESYRIAGQPQHAHNCTINIDGKPAECIGFNVGIESGGTRFVELRLATPNIVQNDLVFSDEQQLSEYRRSKHLSRLSSEWGVDFSTAIPKDNGKEEE